MIKPETTRTLGQAICDHLKLDAGRVASDYTLTHSQGAARVSLTVFLTAEDMASIMRKAAGQSMNPRYPGQLAFVGDPGPELINFNTPNRLLNEIRDPKLLGEIEKVRDQIDSLRKDMNAAAERLAKLQAEQAQPKNEPAKPRDAAPEPQMDQVLAQIKTLRSIVDALSKKQASTGHYPGNALRRSMVFGDKT